MAAQELDQVTVEAVRAIQWQIAAASELGKPAVDALTIATLNATPAEASLLASSFGQVNTGAVRELVGALQSSSPLANLAGLNAEAVEAMGRHLTQGLVNGTNSRVIGRRMAAASDIPLARAQTIARTETHRAFRESARIAMQANPLVEEWIWWASLSPRTCSACWASHGERFSVDDAMPSHVNCRCTQLPAVTPPSWMTDAPVVEYPSGESEFAALSADAQRQILGAGKHDAYLAGDLTLKDTVRTVSSEQWGESRTTASLKDALGARV